MLQSSGRVASCELQALDAAMRLQGERVRLRHSAV